MTISNLLAGGMSPPAGRHEQYRKEKEEDRSQGCDRSPRWDEVK